MADIHSTDRISIGQGIHVRFSTDGRAHSGGCPESDAVQKVQGWLRLNQTHKDRARVEMWLIQKNQQIEQDRQEQQMRAKRAEVDAEVYRAARRATLLKGHEDLIRREIYRVRGIPEED